MDLVDQEMAAKIATLGFPDGAVRICRTCNKSKRVSLDEIQSWKQLRPPDCLICGGRTSLLTPEEHERQNQ